MSRTVEEKNITSFNTYSWYYRTVFGGVRLHKTNYILNKMDIIGTHEGSHRDLATMQAQTAAVMFGTRRNSSISCKRVNCHYTDREVKEFTKC